MLFRSGACNISNTWLAGASPRQLYQASCLARLLGTTPQSSPRPRPKPLEELPLPPILPNVSLHTLHCLAANPDARRQQNANPEERCHFCSCLRRVLLAARADWRPSDCRPASATMSDSGRPIHAMSLRFASRSCESLVGTVRM